MHLLSRPPVPMSRRGNRRTPASAETGVRIGMVAGAGFHGGRVTTLARRERQIAVSVL